MEHIDSSSAISITINPSNPTNNSESLLPFKITYSGDTIPCDSLIDLGHNSTILIHEATYEDDFMHKAAENKHSTISQAIEQGRRMNAKYILLTHFSQRYKIPIIEGNLNENVAVVVDNIELIEDDIPKLSKLYPKICANIQNADYTEKKNM